MLLFRMVSCQASQERFKDVYVISWLGEMEKADRFCGCDAGSSMKMGLFEIGESIGQKLLDSVAIGLLRAKQEAL